MREPTFAEISALAYQLYLEDGKPEGEAENHWQRAREILQHPEMRSAENILSPPSEPEITRSLDARAQPLDTELPSDPHSGPKSWHQHVEIAAPKRDLAAIRKALRGIAGVESVAAGATRGRVRVNFDARKTNPAAIVDLLTPATPAS